MDARAARKKVPLVEKKNVEEAKSNKEPEDEDEEEFLFR